MRVVSVVVGGAVLGAAVIALPVFATSQKGPLLVTVTTSPNPYAIEGSSSVVNSAAVRGLSSASGGTGVVGSATSLSTAAPSYGVYGSALGTGVYGSGGVVGASGIGPIGVFGSGPTSGLSGQLTGTSAAGAKKPTYSAVYGFDDTTNSSQAGLLGETGAGVGVWGYSGSYVGVVGQTGGEWGVAGFGDGHTSTGVYGTGDLGVVGSTMPFNTGGVAVSGDAANTGSVGVLASTTGSNSVGLEVQTSGQSDTPIEVTASAAPIMSLDALGNLTLKGTLTQHGAPASIARDAAGTQRTLYSPQQSEATVEDFGEARTLGGRVRVALDPAFAGLIDPATRYLVFITPEGPSGGYYVADRTPAAFTVVDESNRGSMPFAYRIVARPLDVHGDARLAAYRPSEATRAGELAAQRLRAMPRRTSPWGAPARPALPKLGGATR